MPPRPHAFVAMPFGRKPGPDGREVVQNLLEPDWKTLRVGRVKKFWQQHDDWKGRIEIARRPSRIGDLLVLADEGPVAAFRAEAWIRAGIALRKSGHFALALEYLDKGLAIEPSHLDALHDKGICLQRLAQAGAPGYAAESARQHYQAALNEHPKDVETWALLGRLDKDAWVAAWRHVGSDAGRPGGADG
jgi:tetratricopeptide (TPR) repeat protein